MRKYSRESIRPGSQRRLESYFFQPVPPGAFETITRAPLGSRVHRSESPASTPSTSTTVDGTVVRREADRSIALTSLDSIGLGTGSSTSHPAVVEESCGLRVSQRVGSNLKYSRVVGQHVGQHMATIPERMPGREIRGLEMLRDGHRVAESPTPGKFVVGSQSGKGIYHVEGVGIPDAFESCSCPDFAERNAPCKHIWAARHWIRDPDTSVRPEGSPAKTPPGARVRSTGITTTWLRTKSIVYSTPC
jgi:hypothetical protein